MKRLAALLAVFTLFVLVSGASAKTTYTVRKGDNLHAIAKKFHVSVKDLEKANKVGAKNLRPGAKISIPVKGISSGAAAEASRRDRTADAGRNSGQGQADDVAPVNPSPHETAGEETVKTAKKIPEAKIFHSVRKGDTLRSIAIEYIQSERATISGGLQRSSTWTPMI
jgi:membrane-bound lytic murein transglycosylase D